MAADAGAVDGPRPRRRTVLLAALGAAPLASCTGDDPDAREVTGSWTRLAAPPVGDPVLRAGAAVVWTGRDVLLQGGSSPFADGCAVRLTADGAAWTPGPPGGAGTWTALPPAPVAARSGAQWWWTGSGAVLVGGLDPWARCEGRPAGFLDAAVLTPGAAGAAAGSWERLPDLPWPAGTTVATSAWTGGTSDDEGPGSGRLLVWSPAAGAWGLRLGAPAWTELPAPPLPPSPTSSPEPSWSAVRSWWTGSEWVLAGSVGGPDRREVGLALDPAAGTWRPLDPGPLVRPGSDGVWTGSRLLVFTPQAGVSSFDPATGRWSVAPRGPLDGIVEPSPDGGPALAWTGAELLVWGGARWGRDTSRCVDGDALADRVGGVCDPPTGPLGAAYDPAAGTWRTVPDGPWPRRAGSPVVWTGSSLFLAGGVDQEQRRRGGLPHVDRPAAACALFTP